jgi:hypothetical protein
MQRDGALHEHHRSTSEVAAFVSNVNRAMIFICIWPMDGGSKGKTVRCGLPRSKVGDQIIL